MKLSKAIKKFKNPRVRKRFVIAFTVYGLGIGLAVILKIVYDIGYFNALALKDEKVAKRQFISGARVALNKEYAQRIVSGALKEDPSNPQTVVTRILGHDRDASSIVIKTNRVKKIAWIIDNRLFFIGDIFDTTGYNLTKAVERKHNINQLTY